MDHNDIGLTGDERLRPRQDLEERAAIQQALEATPEEADRVAVPLAPPLSDSIHPILRCPYQTFWNRGPSCCLGKVVVVVLAKVEAPSCVWTCRLS
jgi:hypothetical protein